MAETVPCGDQSSLVSAAVSNMPCVMLSCKYGPKPATC